MTTWEVGSSIEFVTAWEGQVFKQWGNVLAVIPNELIRYSLFAPRPGLEDKPENYFIMHYVLTAEMARQNLKSYRKTTAPTPFSKRRRAKKTRFCNR